MKTKLVLWGENAQNERLLVAVELLMEENKVKIYTFPEDVVTEEVYQKLMNEWRDGKEVELPDNKTVTERDLTIAEGILPEGIKVERADVVLRAQTEWNFLVLSSKLHDAYSSELNELKEKISELKDFDRKVWENLRNFWGKVQEQVKERNLFRHHSNNLKDTTNALFDKMKTLRNKVEAEFKEHSQKEFGGFMDMISAVEEKVVKGSRLQSLFDELKSIQKKYHEAKFTRDDRNKVWKRLDACFKLVKEKKFGNSNNSGQSHLERLDKRYKGLTSAIDRMEQTIKRDRADLEFQKKRVQNTDGQLEAQIREAKMRMIEERVNSKEEKLTDMHKTKGILEQRMASEKKKEEKRQQAVLAKEAAKEKIAEEIKEKAEEMADDAEKLQKAAEAIKKSKTKAKATPKKEQVEETKEDDGLLDAVGSTLADVFEDAVDTVKAIAEVVGDKIEAAVEGLKEDLADKKESTVSTGEAVEPITTEEDNKAEEK